MSPSDEPIPYEDEPIPYLHTEEAHINYVLTWPIEKQVHMLQYFASLRRSDADLRRKQAEERARSRQSRTEERVSEELPHKRSSITEKTPHSTVKEGNAIAKPRTATSDPTITPQPTTLRPSEANKVLLRNMLEVLELNLDPQATFWAASFRDLLYGMQNPDLEDTNYMTHLLEKVAGHIPENLMRKDRSAGEQGSTGSFISKRAIDIGIDDGTAGPDICFVYDSHPARGFVGIRCAGVVKYSDLDKAFSFVEGRSLPWHMVLDDRFEGFQLHRDDLRTYLTEDVLPRCHMVYFDPVIQMVPLAQQFSSLGKSFLANIDEFVIKRRQSEDPKPSAAWQLLGDEIAALSSFHQSLMENARRGAKTEKRLYRTLTIVGLDEEWREITVYVLYREGSGTKKEFYARQSKGLSIPPARVVYLRYRYRWQVTQPKDGEGYYSTLWSDAGIRQRSALVYMDGNIGVRSQQMSASHVRDRLNDRDHMPVVYGDGF